MVMASLCTPTGGLAFSPAHACPPEIVANWHSLIYTISEGDVLFSVSCRLCPKRRGRTVPKAIADARSIEGKYDIIEHTADIGVCVEAETLEEVFALCACALFDLVIDISGVRPKQKAEISIEADTLEELLVIWLNELIFRADVSGMFFSRFEVDSVTGRTLKGSAHGEPYDELKHSIRRHVKAATYHELEVSRSKKGWRARVILDV
jgi:SHS2 domain-containing protein